MRARKIALLSQRETEMTKLFAWLFAATLVTGLGFAPTFAYAADDAMKDAEESGMDSGDDSTMDDSTMDDSGSDEAPDEDPMEEAEGQ
jgi:hypothetical protein